MLLISVIVPHLFLYAPEVQILLKLLQYLYLYHLYSIYSYVRHIKTQTEPKSVGICLISLTVCKI